MASSAGCSVTASNPVGTAGDSPLIHFRYMDVAMSWKLTECTDMVKLQGRAGAAALAPAQKDRLALMAERSGLQDASRAAAGQAQCGARCTCTPEAEEAPAWMAVWARWPCCGRPCRWQWPHASPQERPRCPMPGSPPSSCCASAPQLLP